MLNDPKGGNGMFIANGKYDFPQIKDGLSNTIAIAERPALFVKAPWVGALNQGTVSTTPGAPVFVSEIHPPESMPMARFYTRPINDPWSEPYDFFSPHPSVMNTLFADGSVRPLRFTTPADILGALATIKGQEVVTLPE